jgi:predicted DNA-binding transcriptional regulator YafY
MQASRLLSILMALQLRARVTAEQLAAEFGVSVRTIYRDIDGLSAAGIPVVGDRGPGGGFMLLDGYRTKLTGLTTPEAEALLLIGLPEQADALGLAGAATRAREKLLASLTKEGTAEATRFAGRFHFDTVSWYRNARPVPLLSTIARAVLDQHTLEMSYQSWTASRDWVVEPLGLVLKSGGWYLVANGQGKTRTFNVADVHQAKVTANAFTRPPTFNLGQWWAQSLVGFEARLRPHVVQLCVSPVGIRRLRSLGAYAAKAVEEAGPEDKQGWRKLALPIENEATAALLLLSLGPEFEVLSPRSLKTLVRKEAQTIARHMRQ